MRWIGKSKIYRFGYRIINDSAISASIIFVLRQKQHDLTITRSFIRLSLFWNSILIFWLFLARSTVYTAKKNREVVAGILPKFIEITEIAQITGISIFHNCIQIQTTFEIVKNRKSQEKIIALPILKRLWFVTLAIGSKNAFLIQFFYIFIPNQYVVLRCIRMRFIVLKKKKIQKNQRTSFILDYRLKCSQLFIILL